MGYLPLLFAALTGRSGHGLARSKMFAPPIRSASLRTAGDARRGIANPRMFSVRHDPPVPHYPHGVANTSPFALLPCLEDDLRRVEEELLAAAAATDDFVTELARHLITVGGKLVRPGFCLASSLVGEAEVLGGRGARRSLR